MILVVCPNPSIDTFAWLNSIKFNEVNRITQVKEFPGGKGVHIAFALTELGAKTKLLGNWAGDRGDWIKASCIEHQIEVGGVILKGKNRKCYTFRSSNSDINNTEILEPGPEMNFENWKEMKKLFEKEISTADLICLSGSWPRNAPKDAYRQLIEIANKKNKKVVLDCSGEQLLEALKSSFFAIHLNEHEAFQLCGSHNFEILLEKLDKKIDLVAMTKGKEGLKMWYEGNISTAKVKIDNVKSTVGSGDCLTAGIAWALNKGLSAEEVATFGVACGAANCLNDELGILKREDVLNLLPKVQYKNTENEF